MCLGSSRQDATGRLLIAPGSPGGKSQRGQFSGQVPSSLARRSSQDLIKRRRGWDSVRDRVPLLFCKHREAPFSSSASAKTPSWCRRCHWTRSRRQRLSTAQEEQNITRGPADQDTAASSAKRSSALLLLLLHPRQKLKQARARLTKGIVLGSHAETRSKSVEKMLVVHCSPAAALLHRPRRHRLGGGRGLGVDRVGKQLCSNL